MEIVMGANAGQARYRFSTVWSLPAPRETVRAVLECPQSYPRWWREVRRVVPTGPDSGHCAFRSALPVTLRVDVAAARREPAAGILEIGLSGDLDGFLRWTLTAAEGRTLVRFDQDTALRHPLLRRLPAAARPLLRANHARMMRSGERGLRAWLGAHLEES
ncbi:SRPBCC family protein [Streptomyces sp. RFCAC02]|uniref:SRPBCC family protein n=1 Tax=Streptomyces sp. RFCAC02 TaxID=2499143 RepID=UPI00101F3A0A|nr:SRPBCC family protein [Streptomyces sp. RFCAC02]